MNHNIDIPEDLIKQIAKAKSIAVLTGAGVSAESGIATFRDPDGLWSKFNPAELASAKGFISNPELVWEWYNYRRDIVFSSKPNPGHIAIVELEKLFDDFTLITQNVDGLHQTAGSENVYELHGSIVKNHCFDCSKPFNEEIDLSSTTPPKCQSCSGQIRPSVVWFGEMLPQKALNESEKAAERADVFFSIGTSGEVYPAAGLPSIAKQSGGTVVEINPTATPLSSSADYYLPYPSGLAMPAIISLLENQRRSN
jgi:NAD-dependent deacetylase